MMESSPRSALNAEESDGTMAEKQFQREAVRFATL